ncbi:Fungal-trans domain-containing protein [Fusarium sp. LHS14.1]|nr:Fungal-trans domain-containing protein [Fusarium sp. LHS14.1]
MMSHVPCLHTATFLRQYDKFWENPRNVSITWLGLLYSMMCLSTYFGPSSFLTTDSPDSRLLRRPLYLEQVVQCLRLGEYSRGGPFVLETLIHYFMIGCLRRLDTEVDVWLLFGVLMRLALRVGYHRDPSQFETITPFEGEMRRRIWVTLYSADVMLSMKVGVPRMLQDGQSDTRPPRNLLDSDFDEDCSELPPSRNENGVTPLFYILARYKISKVMGIMMDIVNATQHDESEIDRAEKLLLETYNSLPPILKVTPSCSTLADSPQTIAHRFVLATAVHCSQVILHQHCISAPGRIDPANPGHSLNTLIDAALNILTYHHAIDTVTQPGGRLWSVRWKFSSTLTHEFLLATTVLSKVLFSTLGPHPLVLAGGGTAAKIQSKLEQTHGIWLRLSGESKEARQAADVLTSLFNSLDAKTTSLESLNSDITMVDLESYLRLEPGNFFPSCLLE